MSDFTDVRDFHVKFKLPIDDGPQHLMLPEVFSFRHGFLREELSETADAFKAKDLVKVIDGLIDFVYVVFGTALFMRAGVHPFPRHLEWEWADIDFAFNYGRLTGQAQFSYRTTPDKPGLCHPDLFDYYESKIKNEVAGFHQIHQLGFKANGQMDLRQAAISLSMSHLYWASLYAYVLASEMSLPWSKCWAHVHQKNMEKVRADEAGSNSVRKSPWDVVKPAGWTPPDPLIRQELMSVGAL